MCRKACRKVGVKEWPLHAGSQTCTHSGKLGRVGGTRAYQGRGRAGLWTDQSRRGWGQHGKHTISPVGLLQGPRICTSDFPGAGLSSPMGWLLSDRGNKQLIPLIPSCMAFQKGLD